MSLPWWFLEFKLICNVSYCYKYVLYVVVERQILYTCMFVVLLLSMSSNRHQKYVYTVCF